MLHGRGDTPQPFASLGARMNLPATGVLALSGPREVLFTDGGREWFTNMDDETLELVDGRGLHSFPFPLNLSLLCPFPLNLCLLCPPNNPN
jgi:predicted esterase